MDIDAYLRESGVEFERHAHPTAYSAQQMASVEHVSGYNVAKPVIVKADSGYAMFVLPAPKALDLSKAGRVLGQPDVRLATEEEMAQQFKNCELGAEPPIGAMYAIPTIMDESLKEDEFLVMQAGTHTESIRMRREDWERLCQPQTADVAVH